MTNDTQQLSFKFYNSLKQKTYDFIPAFKMLPVPPSLPNFMEVHLLSVPSQSITKIEISCDGKCNENVTRNVTSWNKKSLAIEQNDRSNQIHFHKAK